MIGVRTVWLLSTDGLIIGRAASTVGAASTGSGVAISGAVVTAASLSVSVVGFVSSTVSLSLAAIFCTAADGKAADSTRLTSRKTAAVTRR